MTMLYTLFNQNQTTLRGHSGDVSSVAFSPDGMRIVSGSDDTVKVWTASSVKRRSNSPVTTVK